VGLKLVSVALVALVALQARVDLLQLARSMGS
jgi:hypothetical protein